MGSAADQGRIQVSGSSTVNSYRLLSSAVRVKRSTTCNVELAPWNDVFSEKFVVDANFTWFTSTDYYNELTKRFDPINSPKFKYNVAANINTNKLGSFLLKLRHVDEFEWADGVWGGTIGPYNIFDIHYNYQITDNLKFGITATNVFDDQHRELIGGAKMGRQLINRLTSMF